MTDATASRPSGLRRLIDAAGDVVAEQGWQEASVVEIGQRAGLSRGAVNYHFGTKDALLQHLVDDLFGRWEATPPSGATPGLSELLDQYSAVVVDDPRRARLLAMLFYESIGPSPEIFGRAREARRALASSVEHQLDRLKDLGEIRSGVDSQRAATYLVGAIAGLAVEPGRKDAFAEFRETALAHLAARGEAREV